MKMRMNAALLLLLSLCAAPMHAMQVDDDQVTPEMREAVNRHILACKLSHAVTTRNHDDVKQLLTQEANPNGTCQRWTPAIFHVRDNNYTAALRAMTKYHRRENPDTQAPLLYRATKSGSGKIVQTLLQYGSSPDCHHGSSSALREAVCSWEESIVSLLLAYKADPNRIFEPPNIPFMYDEYPSPLDLALFHTYVDARRHAKTAKILLAHNARAHGPKFKDLSYPELCALIWPAEDPDLSDAEAHEKQRLFTLDHWNIKNVAQFKFDRKIGRVKGMPRCKCWEVEV